MEEYTNDEILQIINVYKKARARDKKNYQKKKDNPEFIEKNRARATAYYHEHKNRKADDYERDKPYNCAKSLYNYYSRNDDIDTFKEKHKDKYDLLLHRGFFKDF